MSAGRANRQALWVRDGSRVWWVQRGGSIRPAPTTTWRWLMIQRLPFRLDLPFLRKVFKPGLASRKLSIPHEEVLQEILAYHEAGALPCWLVQYDRPELPKADSVDWSKLYARSTERYDHLKLKWWAYRWLQLHQSPGGILGMEEALFGHSHISDAYLAYPWYFERGYPYTERPKLRRSPILVECGATSPTRPSVVEQATSRPSGRRLP